jgi:hypothetical protein
MIAGCLKVLMIGNSFSICVLNYAPKIASELGCKLDMASLYIGGCSLMTHSAHISAGPYETHRPYLVTWHYDSLEDQKDVPFASILGGDDKNRGNIPQMLAADKWDIVTIQQASHDSWRPETFHPWADLVIDAVRKYAPQAEIRIQQTWSYCNADGRIYNRAEGGPGTWGIDQKGMYDKLTKNYGRLAAEKGFRVIPTGKAVQLYRERVPAAAADPGLDVVGNLTKGEDGAYAGDSIHLNKDGEYLQACVWVESLFGVDVRKLKSVPEDLKTKDNAALLRECAHGAVASGIK